MSPFQGVSVRGRRRGREREGEQGVGEGGGVGEGETGGRVVRAACSFPVGVVVCGW